MFNNRLHDLRVYRGFTQQFMADSIGVQLRAYQFYESGDRSPSLDTLVKIADVLKVPTDYLLCRDDFLHSLGVSVDVCLKGLQANPK